MTQQLFRVVFDGELAYGYEQEEVTGNIANLCKYDDRVLNRVFSGRPFIFKSRIDHATAEKYREALHRTGAICRIESMPEPESEKVESVDGDAGFKCPKCDSVQEEGLSCVSCGIVFEKYRRAMARKEATTLPGSDGEPPAEGISEPGNGQDKEVVQEESGLAAYFAAHQEQAFILKAFAMILGIVFLKEFLSGLISLLLFLFPVLFLCYVRLQAATTGQNPNELLAQHITFMPVMYAEGDRKKEGVPWLTYSLILFNILIFYGYEMNADPEFIINNLIFLPNQPTALNVPVSFFTYMFLHASSGHLWGNMLFLWAVGAVVERRVGWQRFAFFYLLSGLCAGVLSIVVQRLFLGQTAHIIGASGAIAGVMGVFAVRCYFKSMVFPLPILGIFSLILPISLKVRLNSLVIIGLFFLADLSGGMGQLTGQGSGVAHWAHIGGMLCGIGLASIFKLGLEAIEERHLDIGSEALSGGRVSLGAGEESLRQAIKRNPNNADALLMLARIESRHTHTEEAASFYERAMALMVGARPQEAAEVFREYYLKYLQGVEAQLLLRLASIFHQGGDLDMASTCLEMLSDNDATPPAIREKAMFQCARVLETLGFEEAALNYYERFVDTFPKSTYQDKVRARLGTI